MKRLIVILITLALVFLYSGCTAREANSPNQSHFPKQDSIFDKPQPETVATPAAEPLWDEPDIQDLCDSNPELYYEYFEYGELAALEKIKQKNEAAFYSNYIGHNWIFAGYIMEINADHCIVGCYSEEGGIYVPVLKVYLPTKDLASMEQYQTIIASGVFSPSENEDDRYYEAIVKNAVLREG